MTFFELYNLVMNKQLKFSRLSTFEDKNEGIFQQFSSQESIFTRYRLNSMERIKEHHKKILINTYASCWTIEPDFISLWAIYSKNKDCFRVSTTTSKLELVVKKFFNDNFAMKFMDEVGSRRFVTQYYKTGEVTYHDPFVINSKLQEKFKKIKQAITKNIDDIGSEKFFADYQKAEDNQIIPDSGLFMKNRTYTHEQEYRATIRCGVRSDLPKEKIMEARGFQPIGIDFGEDHEMPNYIFIETDNTFIDEICIDPRMPEYQQTVIKDIFKKNNIPFISSDAFGCYLEGNNVSTFDAAFYSE